MTPHRISCVPQVARIQPGAVVDVVDGDGVVVTLAKDVEVELVVVRLVAVLPIVVEVELDAATVVAVPTMVVDVDGAGDWRPQSGGVEAALDLHAFRLRFRVATQAARQALPALRAGQAALHSFVCWPNSRRQSRGHRAATIVELTIIQTRAMTIDETRIAFA